ncbi:MAG: hypothetical protein ACFFD3_07200 [Candidatus Thorarchaeota archaeon]
MQPRTTIRSKQTMGKKIVSERTTDSKGDVINRIGRSNPAIIMTIKMMRFPDPSLDESSKSGGG